MEPDSMIVMRIVVKRMSHNPFSDHCAHGMVGELTLKNILLS